MLPKQNVPRGIFQLSGLQKVGHRVLVTAEKHEAVSCDGGGLNGWPATGIIAGAAKLS